VRLAPLVVGHGADLDALVALDRLDEHLAAGGVEPRDEAVRAVEALRRAGRGEVPAHARVEDADAEVVEVGVRLAGGIAVVADADEASAADAERAGRRREAEDEEGRLGAHPRSRPRERAGVEPEDGVAVDGEEALVVPERTEEGGGGGEVAAVL